MLLQLPLNDAEFMNEDLHVYPTEFRSTVDTCGSAWRIKKMLAHVPDARDAPRIPIFVMSSKTPSSKAREAMNKDIVNPIPQSQAAPKSVPHESSGGAEARVVLAESHAKSQIPRGLPTNSPRAMPKVTGCRVAAAIFPDTRTPEFANAKSGMIAKLTQG